MIGARRVLQVAGLAAAAVATFLLLGFAGLRSAPHVFGVRGMTAPDQERIALMNVQVAAPGYAPGAGRTILIAGGRIETVTIAGKAPPTGYLRIDGRGRWAAPGLIDAHVHVVDEGDMAQLLSHGVTTARNMLGLPVHLKLRDAAAAGRIVGPRLITAGPTLNSVVEPGSFHTGVADPAHGREQVQRIRARGYDLVKVYSELKPDAFLAIADEAAAQGLPVAGHPGALADLDGLLARVQSVEHSEELRRIGLKRSKPEKRERVIRSLIAARTPVVATLVASRRLDQVCGGGDAALDRHDGGRFNSVYRWIGRRLLGEWARGERDCAKWRIAVGEMDEDAVMLARAGVPIALGSDSGPQLLSHGRAATEELALLRAAGFTDAEVFDIATRNSALAVGRAGDLGRIAPGMRADILLLERDPREDVLTMGRPVGLVADGRWYDRDRLDRVGRAGRRHSGPLLTIARMLQPAL